MLGGLVGKDQIVVLPERVRKLTSRLKSWITLGKLPASERKLSLLVYGFPPNVGAVGTAALLNVARSLRNLLLRLSLEGYNIGSSSFQRLLTDDLESGDKLVRALSVMSQNPMNPKLIVQELASLGLPPSTYIQREVSWRELQGWLGKTMSNKVAKQWGDLDSYTGLGTTGAGKFLVQGFQFGNLFIGIQPLLGVEGDPMRLLFERDLTPHPQYAAYYSWLQHEYHPNALIHFGMHGTSEWLPGNPLGNTPESWPDVLMGDMPNLYVYACNNPSESILAKRRGYATIISHNVPPYSRAGLYNELKQIRALTNEYREAKATSSIDSDAPAVPESSGVIPSGAQYLPPESPPSEKYTDLIPSIVALVDKAGLFTDLPYTGKYALPFEAGEVTNGKVVNAGDGKLTAEHVEELLKGSDSISFTSSFEDHLGNMTSYLAEVETRLFSEGLYEIGSTMTPSQINGYLTAVIDEGKVSEETLHTIATKAVDSETSTSILLGVKAQGNSHTHTGMYHSYTSILIPTI